MPKKKFGGGVKFVEVENLKQKRFNFIKDETLKTNIAIKMQYVVFLVSLEEEYELPGAATYSTFKTIILFTASIIESLINYKIGLLIKNKEIEEDKVMGTDKKYECFKKRPVRVSDKESIIFGVKKIKVSRKLKSDTNFVNLNKAAKISGLFDEALFNKSEEIRGMRNRIHLPGLKEVDDKYTKEDINRVFLIAKEIMERIETYHV